MWHSYQMSETPTHGDTKWYWHYIPLHDSQQGSVTAMRSANSATCHGCELQQWLCRHLDDHASLQVGLVTFNGNPPVLGLNGAHGVLRGLQGRLYWDVLAQGLVLVCVYALPLLWPGAVQQLLTLRRIGNVGARHSSSEKITDLKSVQQGKRWIQKIYSAIFVPWFLCCIIIWFKSMSS